MTRNKSRRISGGGDSAACAVRDAKRHERYRYLINFLYPNRCPGCGKIIAYNAEFCGGCTENIVPYSGSVSIPYTDAFTAYCVFDDGMIRRVIHGFKDDPCGNTYYACARGIYRSLTDAGLDSGIDVITYVPMSKKGLSDRGYNQTELIARELRYMLKVPVCGALDKIKETREQKNLSMKERMANVAGAYAVIDKSAVEGKSVLLIDDVCTTGSTLSETAKMLRQAGAARIVAAAFAKTMKKEA